ncbi:MAG: endonuclease MutS2 [Planctomycetota bacterium]
MSTPGSSERLYDLDALEFDFVRSRLAALLRTPVGRSAVEGLGPLPDLDAARFRHAAVRALADLLARDSPPPLSGAVEVRSWLESFFAGEHRLRPRDAADLKRALRAGERCRRWLLASGSEPLRVLGSAAPDLDDLVSELELVVDDRGEVLDTASSRLREVRSAIEAQKLSVAAAIHAVISDASVQKCLQAPEPAWRNGRPVLQVKVEHRHRIPGVLHDRSASGATLFVEPDRVVEVANRLSDLIAREAHEVDTALAHAARGLLRMRAEIGASIRFLSELDLLHAASRLVVEHGHAVPTIERGGHLRLVGARHPMLGGQGERVVPLDLGLGDPHRVLVVTGPNTGGKTVVLKTVGLLSLMALSGLPVPAAEGTRFPWFSAVLADIGDQQGISQNLSTFSSHVKRIVRCIEHARADSLVLLDELGAGTDPEEGGALGYAVLEELLAGAGLAVVTTHIGRLKEFAHRHPMAENGAMAFDGDTLAPLFRLDVGIPGSSHALAIARRVGVPGRVVDRAEALLGTRDVALQQIIQRVQDVRRDAEEDRRRTAEARIRADEQRDLLERQRSETERRSQWLSEEADQVVEQELRRIRDLLAEPLKFLAGAPGRHGERARDLQGIVDGLLKKAAVHRRRMAFCCALRKGDSVFLPRWNRTCRVLKVDRVREIVIVEHGKLRLEVPFEDVSWLRPLSGA